MKRIGAARAVVVGLLVLAAVVAVVLVLAALVVDRTGPTLGDPLDAESDRSASPSAGGTAPPADLDVALSTPVEDSYYPAKGDPGVDTLHYALDRDPTTHTLTGIAEVTLRAVRDAGTLQLDLIDELVVGRVTVDGQEATHQQGGNHLRISHPVTGDRRYQVRVEYAGTPEPVRAPTRRSDLRTVGLTETPTGELWTMQEPFGAHTWYPVNDQPADKALYDFTVRVPEDWVGVANGELTSREVVDGQTVTTWHLDTPASSYLTTLAVGDLELTEDVSGSDVPISYWTPADAPELGDLLRVAPEAMDGLEEKLRPSPFDSLGFVVVDSESAMETQTMVTLGDTPYTTSPAVIVHEMAHQWYGDSVSPTDWRDVWMNEGMTMYVQLVWESEETGQDLDAMMDQVAAQDRAHRREAGPPGRYLRDHFGSGNIYFCPALMWHELRERIGEQEFWAMVRSWPVERAGGGAPREEFYDWVEQETGEELSRFFDAWIMGTRTPPVD